MTLPSFAALVFLPVVTPLCLALVWTDLSRMKIPNWITDALLVAFVPLALIALPWQVALWQLAHPAVMFALGIILYSLRLYGGGDVKFLIAASPYVMLNDVAFVLVLLAAFLLAGFALHRAVRASPLRRLAPDWVSWGAQGKYPMGLSLGPTLITYLILAATG